MGPIGMPELLIILLIVVFIFAATRIGPGVRRSLRFYHGRRPLFVAGRMDADDRFRTENWEDPLADRSGEIKRQGRLTLMAALLVVIGLAIAWIAVRAR